MLKRLIMYAVLLGAMAFVMQILQRSLNLSSWHYYLVLTILAILFIAAGFLLGRSWNDQTNLNIRKNMYLSRLSEREREVAILILSGLSNKQILEELHVEQSTLKTHINQVYKKCGTPSRKEFKLLFQEDKTAL